MPDAPFKTLALTGSPGELSTLYTFLLWQLGEPEFQPPPPTPPQQSPPPPATEPAAPPRPVAQ
jgi:hypothetical protein